MRAKTSIPCYVTDHEGQRYHFSMKLGIASCFNCSLGTSFASYSQDSIASAISGFKVGSRITSEGGTLYRLLELYVSYM